MNRYVGYDGESYYCRLCGRAGFASAASVIGHLRWCKSAGGAGGAGGGAGRSADIQDLEQARLKGAGGGARRSTKNQGLEQTRLGGARGRSENQDLRVVLNEIRNLSRRLERVDRLSLNENAHLRKEIVELRGEEWGKTLKYLLIFAAIFAGMSLIERIMSSEGEFSCVEVVERGGRKIFCCKREIGLNSVFEGVRKGVTVARDLKGLF